MQLRITINLDNAAFKGGGVEEVERLLADIATRIPDPLDQTGGALNLTDCNGNHVGTAEIRRGAVDPGELPPVPAGFPVQPLKHGESAEHEAQCGACGRRWDDGKPTAWTPAPAGRCPFEYFH